MSNQTFEFEEYPDRANLADTTHRDSPTSSDNYPTSSQPSPQNQSSDRLPLQQLVLWLVAGSMATAVVYLGLNLFSELAASKLFMAGLVVVAFVWGMAAMRFYDEQVSFYLFKRNLAKARGELGVAETEPDSTLGHRKPGK